MQCFTLFKSFSGSVKWQMIKTGIFNCFRYHLGSVAFIKFLKSHLFSTVCFGSLILAIVNTINWFIKYVKKMADSKFMCFLNVIVCCCRVVEELLKSLTGYAYVQTALVGSGFCKSAKDSFLVCKLIMFILPYFQLLSKYAIVLATVVGVSGLISFISVFVVTVSTTTAGCDFVFSKNPCTLGTLFSITFMLIELRQSTFRS